MSSVLLLDVRSRHGLAECVLSEWNGHSNARMDTFWWSGQPMALRSGRLPQCPRLPGKLIYVSHSYLIIINWLNAYCFRPVRDYWTQLGASGHSQWRAVKLILWSVPSVFKEGGIFIVPYLMWHGTPVYSVSPEGERPVSSPLTIIQCFWGLVLTRPPRDKYNSLLNTSVLLSRTLILSNSWAQPASQILLHT